MAKKKLLAEIKLCPPRFYRLPGDVLRDRRFSDGERLEILKAWASQADVLRAREIAAIIDEIERRVASGGHAAE
jgi:hypothetical protein